MPVVATIGLLHEHRPAMPRSAPAFRMPHSRLAALGTVLGVLLLCTALVLPAQSATRIYRSVDADGNIVFSDVAPRPDEHAEAVELPEPNRFDSDLAPEPSISLEDWQNAGADDEERAPPYQRLAVAEPANDATVRSNPGDVLVVAALQPELDPGHLLQLYVDGALHQSGQRTSFQLTNVDRGTHTLELKIVDARGNTVIESDPSVFHLQRYSQLLAPNRGR